MDHAEISHYRFLDSLSESIALFDSKKNEILYLNSSLKNYLISIQQPKKIKTIFELVKAINPLNSSILLNFMSNYLSGISANYACQFKAIKNNKIINSNLSIYKSETNGQYFFFFNLNNELKLNNFSSSQNFLVDEYAQLAEHSNEWVWEVDTDCRYIKSNFAVYDILGYYPDEIIGKTPFELMPLREAKRIKELFSDIEKTKVNIHCLKNYNITKAGSIIQLETYGMPIYDDFGTYKGYRGIDYPNFVNLKLDKSRFYSSFDDRLESEIDKIRILVIDDQKLTTDLLNESFYHSESFKLTAISNIDENDLSNIIENNKPDILLVFVNFPNFKGLNLINKVLSKSKELKVIAITECSKPILIQKIINYGVHGCITMLSSKEDLIECIKSVIDGIKYYCKTTKNVLSNSTIQSLNSSFDSAFEK
jgi:PAS domain S-box-containing protein